MLAEFLPPKQEFVLAVRITPLQYKLYRYYLDHITGKNLSAPFCRVSAWNVSPDGCFCCLPAVSSMAANVQVRTSANLFKDFQVLSQIWNHPWCLQLNWEKKVSENTFWFRFFVVVCLFFASKCCGFNWTMIAGKIKEVWGHRSCSSSEVRATVIPLLLSSAFLCFSTIMTCLSS